jgi:tRNA-specific 2-thiouridylase
MSQLAPARRRVVVGLSGGVDSAVAALLLVRAGHAVQGLFMANWDDDDSYCTQADDFQDARAVAAQLGIPLHRVNFSAEYRARVFADFLHEYAAGRTPNPDVLCNREIKFGVCLRHARRLGGEYFATGHYARLRLDPDGPALLKARDAAKDQSYFLHAVARDDLASAMFPLGDLLKAEVRALAREAGLPVHDKPDSTGICFIGERPFREFLQQHLPARPGPILSAAGERLGEHVGLPYYTLGQRGGLQIGGRSGADEAPWYVAAKDALRNALIVVQGHDHPLLLSTALQTGPMHWLCPPRQAPFAAGVRLRHRQADQDGKVLPLHDGRVRIDFTVAQRAATPGQYAVLYDGERCLGGAVIEQTFPLQDDSALPGAANTIPNLPVEVA